MVALSDQPGAGSSGAGQLRVLATPDRNWRSGTSASRPAGNSEATHSSGPPPRATARGRGAPATKKVQLQRRYPSTPQAAPGGWVSKRSTEPAPNSSLRFVALDVGYV